jgi:Bacterial archaeo-eukaryotic release factor family 2
MNLAGIQHLYNHDGPFLSLHLDVSREAEGVTKGVESGWNSVRRELMSIGADEALVERVGEIVRKPTGMPGAARRTVVAEGDAVLFDDVRMGVGAWPEVTTIGPLPDVSGWVAQVDGEFPFLLVVADREGAEVDVYRSLSQQEHQHTSVEGQTLHINKVPAGEWAELQQHTEEVWRRNARSVAETVQSAGKQYGAKLVLLAGEVRARAEIQEALGSGGNLEVVEIESGGRAAGSSSEALWREVDIALGQQWQQERQGVRDRLQEQSGQNHAIARGLRDVLEALVRGQVERLVLDLGAAHEQTVAPGDYPGIVLPSAAFEGRRLPADQTLLAAGASTDAEVTVLPSTSIGGDGIAALLRWDGQGA